MQNYLFRFDVHVDGEVINLDVLLVDMKNDIRVDIFEDLLLIVDLEID